MTSVLSRMGFQAVVTVDLEYTNSQAPLRELDQEDSKKVLWLPWGPQSRQRAEDPA